MKKYDLFSKIVKRGEVDKELFADKIALENFWKKYHSSPLDVSVAAYYLKETGMPLR